MNREANMNKDMVRWALAMAELKGRYAEKGYVSSDARDLLEQLDRINAQVLRALGLDEQPAAQEIDFHTLQPTSQVAS